MPAETTFELVLEPAETGMGWTAMVYRSIKAGICGPFTDTKPVELPDPHAMFHPVEELAAAALRTLKLDREFTTGPAEVYGRYGSIALQVPLTPITTDALLPATVAWIHR